MGILNNLEKVLASGRDSALLRYSLGIEYHKKGELDKSTMHLSSAVEQDPDYSAAWKAYGAVLAATGHYEASEQTYITGIGVAERNGDIQAAREMKVFLKRVQKLSKEEGEKRHKSPQ